jgi:tetratricopeptide (TPR) repeat protein
MASVFLSYDRDDSHRARHFARALEKAGHQVWWDLHVRSGAQFSKVIEEALKAADVVVVLWSQFAIDSAWVRDEAAAGRDTNRLVPVTIDGTEPPLGFRQFQTIDLSRWRGRGSPVQLRTLLADIESTVARPDPGPSPRPVPKAAPPRVNDRLQLKTWLVVALIFGIGFVILGLAIGRPWERKRSDIPSVAVTAAEGSPLSQGLAHNVLVNLGSIAGNPGSNFRLLDEGSRVKGDFRLTVSGIQQGSGTQATVALTSSRQDGILWSKQVQEPANQRASLDQAVAYAAMGAIACATDDSAGESRRLSAAEFHAYVNACASLDDADDLQPLVGVFRKTVEAAPRFTAAWARLLDAESDNLYDLRISGEPTAAIESAMRRDIKSARNLSRDLPEAAMAEVNLQPPTAFLKRIALIDKAVEAHPDNANLLITQAQELSQVGRMDGALGNYQHAAKLKPYSASIRSILIVTTASSGGVAKAWADLAEAKKLWPNSPPIASAVTYINMHYGDFEKTWRAAGRPIDGGISGYFRVLREPTDANIDAWVNLAKTHKMLHPHRMFILQALGPLNRVDELYTFLDQWPMEQDLQGMTYVLFRPWLANVRRDPRFIRLAQRVGLLDYWEKSGQWPDFCAEPDMPYDCKAEAAKLQ